MLSSLFLAFSLIVGGVNAIGISVDCTQQVGALVPFWKSVGYTPAEYALRGDELENTLLIGSTPNRGVTQVRIHYLLDLITITGFAPSTSTPSGYIVSYIWAEMDHALDFLVAMGLSPGFEFMGSPDGMPNVPYSFYNTFNGNGHVLPAQTFALWRQLCGDIMKRYIARYGVAEVEAWHLEDWNEPDQGWGWQKPANTTDPVLSAFVMYWDATTAGIEDAEAATGAKLYFGGTASGKAAGDTYYLAHMLDHKVQNVNSFNGAPVRWDYITAHVKGQSTSYVTVVGEWAVSELIRSNTDWANAMSTLPISNDEGDPMVGWEAPTDWRGDARYAAIIPKMVNQHLLAINDNNTVNPLGWLSFDGAFMNGAGDNYTGFGMRTMTTRFGDSSTDAPVAFVRKNGLAAFTLLSFLGDERCASSGAATPSNVLTANVGVLATKRAANTNDAAQATVLIYNSADCTDDVAPSITADINLTGLPFPPVPADGSVVAALYIIDNVLSRSPVGAWAAMGSPLVPSRVQLETLWSTAANMTTASLIMPIAVTAGGSVIVPRITVALPGMAVWHFAEKASAPATPATPKGLVAFSKSANMSLIAPTQQEVLLRWDCTSVSRVIASYQVEYSASGAAPWAVINAPPFPSDIMCSINHIAPAGSAFYKVSATDYFGRVSVFSTIATAMPWPLFAQ